MKLLPIGSVVKVKGQEVDVMLCGYFHTSDDGQICDYVGCPFPMGSVSSEKGIAFNSDDVDKVLFIGYIDARTQMLHARLSAEYDKLKHNE